MSRSGKRNALFLKITAGGIAFVLAAYIGFLLVSNYSKQKLIHEALLAQIQQACERRTIVLEKFFHDRKEDLRHLSLSREVSVFFENRALGMSLDYGLNLSLVSIHELFSATITRQNYGGRSYYSRIVLADKTGKILVDTAPQIKNPQHRLPASYDFPLSRQGKTRIAVNDDGVIASAAYFFKGDYTGQIVAWMNPDVLVEHLLNEKNPDAHEAFIMVKAGDGYLSILGRRGMLRFDFRDIAVLSNLTADALKSLPTGEGQPVRIALTLAIPDTSFYLVTLFRTAEVLNTSALRQLIFVMIMVAALILAGAGIITVIYRRSLALQIHLRDSLAQKREVQEKHQFLEKEMAERKKAEEALRESEKRLISIFNAQQNGIVIIEPQSHRIVDANMAALDMIGTTREEIVGRECHLFICPADRGRCPVTDLGQELDKSERLLIRPDGTKRSVLKSVSWLHLESGKYLIESFIDITERKQAEERLKQSEEMFRNLVGNMLDAAIIIDWEGTILFANQAAANLVELEVPEQAYGHNMAEFIHPESLGKAIEDLELVKLGASGFPGEYKMITAGGNHLWVNSLGVGITFKGQAADLVTLRNMTERKQMEDTIRYAKVTAEAANRAKSEFLANMSHELRTPLNAIIGFTEILLDQHFGDINRQQDEYLNDILSSSRHLLLLINDILDLSKIEAGKMELQASEINLRDLLSSSLHLIKEKSAKHGFRIRMELEDSLPETIVGDERKMKQIIFNLLSNAAKFTSDGGSVTLTASLDRPQNGNGSRLKLSVADTGIGIKPEDLERIFKPFEQADGSASKRYQGTGLGLSLSRQLAQLHGGSLWAQSEGEGRGSTFYVEIPVRNKNLTLNVETPAEVHQACSRTTCRG